MTTASDVINSALRSIWELADGETPSPETSANCLALLNEMLDSWSTERLMAPYLQSETFSLVGGTASYTVGASGVFNTTRPVSIDDASYTTVSSVDYPIKGINRPQYDSFPDKTTQGSFPNYFYYSAAYPLGTVFFYPVPSSAISFKMVSWKQQTVLATLATVFSVAPGMIRTIRSNLAIEIAADFGVTAPPDVKSAARQSKRNMKRINAPNDVLGMPLGILNRRGQGSITGDIV